VEDQAGHKVVVLPEILFRNKQNIDWNAVESYLEQYVGEIVKIMETERIVHIGRELPDEYKGSEYTKRLKGARAKAKANAAQGILQMVEIATNEQFCENRKERHSERAGKGWYYYQTRFAIPVFENEERTEMYHIYSACLLINCTKDGRMYLYDLVDIKREASTPLRTECQTSGKKPLPFVRE